MYTHFSNNNVGTKIKPKKCYQYQRENNMIKEHKTT